MNKIKKKPKNKEILLDFFKEKFEKQSQTESFTKILEFDKILFANKFNGKKANKNIKNLSKRNQIINVEKFKNKEKKANKSQQTSQIFTEEEEEKKDEEGFSSKDFSNNFYQNQNFLEKIFGLEKKNYQF